MSLVAVTINTTLVYVSHENNVVQERTLDFKSMLARVQESINEILRNEQYSLITMKLQGYSLYPGIDHILIVNAQGDVVTASRGDWTGKNAALVSAYDPETARLAIASNSEQIQFNRITGRLYGYAPLVSAGLRNTAQSENRSTLFISYDISKPIAAGGKIVIAQGILYLLFMLAATLLLVLLVDSLIGRRLGHLVDITRRLGAGELEVRSRITGGNEITDLGHAFNKMAEQLQNSEKLMREHQIELDTIIDNLPLMLFMQDARDLRLIRINKAGIELIGQSPVQLLGKSDFDLFKEEQASRFTAVDHKVLRDPGLVDISEAMINTSRGQRTVNTRKVAICGTDGNPKYLVGLSEDITERKQTEAKFQLVFEASPAGMLLVDAAGKITLANTQIKRIFGYTRNELLGQPVELLMPEDLGKVHGEYRNHFIKYMETRPMGAGRDLYGRHKDGRKIPLEIGLNPIDTPEGQQVLAVINDISARKWTEQSVANLAERLDLATRAAHLGIWDWNIPENQLVWDGRMFELYGVKKEDFAGAYEAWLAGVHPDDRARCDEAIRMALRNEKPYDIEFRVQWPDGTIRNIKAAGLVMRDKEGRPLRMTGTTHDITERKQQEMANRLLSTVVKSSDDAIITQSLDHSITSWNIGATRMFGYSETEVLGQPITILLPSDKQFEDISIKQRFQNGEKIDNFEITVRCKEKKLIDIAVTISPLRNKDGQLIGSSIIARDITKRKQTERALRELTEDLDRRVIARTQELDASRAQLRALVAQLSQAEERERRRLSLELHDYLAQTLTLIRITLGRALTLAPNADVNNLLTETQQWVDDAIGYTRTVIAQLSPDILYNLGLPAALSWLSKQQMKHHGLAVDVQGGPKDLQLDEERLVLTFQCIRELLWNVVKHAQATRVTLTYQVHDHALLLEVADNGRGFDPEGNAKRRTGDLAQGFGLFSIGERLALHGGRLEVHASPGQGTQVTLFLPLRPIASREPALPKTAPVPVPAISAPPGGVLRIVLVDDHAVMRQGLRRMLEDYTDLVVVGEAEDGLEALDLVRAEKPDVVLMDITLPRLSGIEATRHIMQELPGTIVIGLSFISDAQTTQALKDAGAYACVAKERAMVDIYRTIMEAVAERQTSAP